MHIISVVKKLFQKNQIDNTIQHKFIRHILREDGLQHKIHNTIKLTILVKIIL